MTNPSPLPTPSSPKSVRRDTTVRVPQNDFVTLAARFSGEKGDRIAKRLIESPASEAVPWVGAIRQVRNIRPGELRKQFTFRPDVSHVLKIEMVVAEFARRFPDEREPSMTEVIGGLYLLHAREQEPASTPLQTVTSEVPGASLIPVDESNPLPTESIPTGISPQNQAEGSWTPTFGIGDSWSLWTRSFYTRTLVILILLLGCWAVNRVANVEKKVAKFEELSAQSERTRISEQLRYERITKLKDEALERQLSLNQALRAEIQTLKNQHDSVSRKPIGTR